MEAPSSVGGREWHIPRPSLGGSAGGTDSRSRGGSASSQGSSSNHSTHSASSGSLLLSAAHLAKVHSHHHHHLYLKPSARISEDEASNYRSNLTSYVENERHSSDSNKSSTSIRQHRKLRRTDRQSVSSVIPEETSNCPDFFADGESLSSDNEAPEPPTSRSGDPLWVDSTENVPSALQREDPFWRNVADKSGKVAKADDAASVASSTHFTLVNGFGRRPKVEKKRCCGSHRLTILVMTMTVLFSACILAAICFVEMRVRRDHNNYRFS